MNVRRSLLVWALLLGVVSQTMLCSVSAQEVKPGLVVLGVLPTMKDAEWRQGLVGLGIHNRVAQVLYNTGRFRMLEEKPEVLRALHPGLEAVSRQIVTDQNLPQISKVLKADYVVQGQVISEFSRPSGMTFGVINRQQRETTIKVELTLYHASSRRVVKALGQGKEKRGTTNFVADYGFGKIPFDPSTVGPATQEAVISAVAKLMEQAGQARIVRQANPSDPGTATPLTIAVSSLDVNPEVARRYPELMEKRVAFGMHNRIATAVRSNPRCQLQEINPEVLKALEIQYWIRKTGTLPGEAAASHTSEVARNLDWVIYGEVFNFTARPVESKSAWKGQVNSEVIVGVQLRAIAPNSQTPHYLVASALGTATGDWEKWKATYVSLKTGAAENDDQVFQQTFVGQATSRAIETAWNALLRDLIINRSERSLSTASSSPPQPVESKLLPMGSGE